MEPSNKTTQEQIDELLAKTAADVKALLTNRDKLLRRKPFTRGGVIQQNLKKQKPVHLGSKVAARQSSIKKEVITQDEYMSELDPYMHSVLYDENIPSICVKTAENGVQEIKFVKAAQPFQQCIMEKQTLHMACLPMKFTLADKKPTETVQADFVTFKHYWDLRDEVIDAWDDDNLYRIVYLNDSGDYSLQVESHPFGEIPLITKRTKVAWDAGQTLIESYERLDNIFKVLQNKFGWGLLWVKGRIDPKAKKIAGNIVLNDTSYEGKGDAKFLEPPSPQNTIATLDQIFAQIQIATGTTFILPKDIHTSSDTSGIAVQMTQSLDIQTAKNGIVEWQNVADKMVRLFKRGLAVELVKKGIKKDAITEFDKMNINAQFDIWQPFSETEYNNMLVSMKNGGILSQKTAVEVNTISRPDEVERIQHEQEELAKKELDKLEKTGAINAKYASKSNKNNKDE